MNTKNKPTVILSVDDLKKFVICGLGNELRISNEMNPKIVIDFLEMFSEDIKIVIFDQMELNENGIDLKKNGRVQFKLNKQYTVLKQTYYYNSKNK